jgi:pimeloyl-ACP methyl ester carboxylesterase
MENVISSPYKTKEGEKDFFDAYHKSLSLWKVDFETFYIDTSYGRTHVLAVGPTNGDPVVLLHGFGFSSTMWYPNINILSKNNRVYAIDVLGEFNKSIASKSFQKKTHYAEWLSEVLDSLEIGKISFIGHSNGGWHAINFAIHSPDRINKLMLLAPAASFIPFSKQFPLRLVLANIIKTRRIIIDFFGKWFVAKGNTVQNELFEQFYKGLINFKWEHKILIPSVFKSQELENIRKIPTLLLVGDKEVIYNHTKLINEVNKAYPNIKTTIIANASHALSIEKASEVNSHLINFLNDKI